MKMRFIKIFRFGAILTALCALRGAAAPGTGFAYRANEKERLRQMQDAFMKIKRMIQVSRSKPETIDELNKFAEGAVKKYRLSFSLEDIRLHGKLLKIIRGDRQAVAEARTNRFVICGVIYGKKCWNCRGNGKKCTYCQGTGKCPSCEGTGKMNFASKGEDCVQCEGSSACPKCKGTPESNPCNICEGTGIYCDPATLKGRQRRLFAWIMEARITEASKYDYLGSLYMDGADGFPKDGERARLFFGMAEKAGFVKNEIARVKRAGACSKSLESLEWVAERYPGNQDAAEAKALIVVFRDKLLNMEIQNAERVHSNRAAIEILEKAIEKYPDARNISVANNKLQHYRQQYKAEQERQRESYGGGFKVIHHGSGGGMSWGGGGFRLDGATSTGFRPVGGIRGPRRR